MNWSDDKEGMAADEAGTAGAEGAAGHTALFFNDTGEMGLETRRVLVQLLAGPALDGRRHSKLWPVLITDEAVIRRRLCELFLELVIDRDMQVAFTRQADTGELEVPLLLRRRNLSFLESVLLLHLRQRLTHAATQGERAVISTDEIVEHLSLYDRAGSTDQAGFLNRAHGAIEKIKKHSILRKIRASDDRFEISPTLKLLFSAAEIKALTDLYGRMAAGEPLPTTPTADPESEPEDEL